MGNLYQQQSRLTEALACHELSLVHESESAVTKWRSGGCPIFAIGGLRTRLALSNMNGGGNASKRQRGRLRAAAAQDGLPLGGRTLLVYMEQGLGDMIQFIRFAVSAKERGGRVLVEVSRISVSVRRLVWVMFSNRRTNRRFGRR